MATDCEGTWGNGHAVDMESDLVYVHRCSGCGERLVIIASRAWGPYPPEFTAEEAIRLAMAERALDRL